MGISSAGLLGLLGFSSLGGWLQLSEIERILVLG